MAIVRIRDIAALLIILCAEGPEPVRSKNPYPDQAHSENGKANAVRLTPLDIIGVFDVILRPRIETWPRSIGFTAAPTGTI
jgi:hypothetical protein